jgi:flagellar biogenesis protein FliO
MAATEKSRARPGFPTRTLVAGAVLLAVGLAVFTFVDRIAPAPAPAPKAPQSTAEKPKKELLKSERQPFTVNTIAITGAVLAGAIALTFALKRLLKGSRHHPEKKRLLKIRDVLPIGPKRAVYLIGLEHRNLVVGLSGDQLTLLSEYSEEPEEGAEAVVSAAPKREVRTVAIEAPVARINVAASSTAGDGMAESAQTETAKAASTVDFEVGDEIAAEGDVGTPAAMAHKPAASHRVFGFPSVGTQAHRNKPNAARVPHKFRQLLEQAAQAQESNR